MDGTRFDSLTRLLGRAPSRRATLALLGGLLAAPGTGGLPVDAKKKNKNKEVHPLPGWADDSGQQEKEEEVAQERRHPWRLFTARLYADL